MTAGLLVNNCREEQQTRNAVESRGAAAEESARDGKLMLLSLLLMLFSSSCSCCCCFGGVVVVVVVCPRPCVIETIPLKLFAKVEKDGKPVFDARVWATVTIKRQQEEDFSATRAMLDDGRGDPDIQRGDGVYTTYFTNFVTATSVSEYRFVFACDDNGGHARVPSDDQHKSSYEYGFEYFKQHPEEEAAAGRQGSDDEKTAGGVPVTTATPVPSAPMSDEHARKERQVAARSLPIDDDRRNEDYWDANAAPRPLGSTSGSQKTGVSACCGSEPVDVVLEPSGPFSSFSSGGLETIIFNVPATSGSLIFPPSRVMDLKVDVFDVSGVFRLTWSAPGDEYTVGTVSQYVIAYGEDWDSVAYYQDGVKTFVAPMEPHSYGSAETLDLNATDLGLHAGTVYYFSVRGCDQASKCGSPSNVVLASASPTAGPEFANAASAPGFAGLPGNKLAGLSTGETFGIVFGCFGFVLLMIAACVFYMVFVRRRKSSSDKAAMARKTGGSGGSSGGGSNGGMTGSGGGVANNAVRHSTPTPYVSEEEGNKMTGNNGDISTISNGQVGSPSYVPASQLLGAHEKQMQTNGDVYGTYQETTVYAKETEEAYIPDYSQGYDVGSYYYAEGYDAYGMPVAGYTGYTQQAYVQQGSGRSSRHSDSTTNSIPSQRYDTQQAFEHYAGAYDGPGAEQLYARPNKMGPNTSYDQLQMAGSRHSNVSHQTPPQSGTAPRIRNITQV
ncbi:unnamed protein product [Notodromas monacha]|uniref:Fibronectin type-III domain-containing protein n=1 Tax=Notodromas monacha TaxID=399045 RepID=A0A7R9BT63_9CRUS|nr:unnamed protein product [Notodromas monacha]CAG0920223.1 unnamed protein product [Notodromas monacha]